jgi:formylglycine-generating enzyme required for sulfatase activity
MRVGRSVFLLAPWAAGCSLFLGISAEDYASHGPDGGDGDVEAAPSGPDAPDAMSANGCPGTAGPTAIRIDAAAGSFCIDTTEVTNGQYKAFLAAKGTDTSGQPERCSFNTSFAPGGSWPLAASFDDLPVLSVDWCDAYAYCDWAGKRLCGLLGGGTVAPSNNQDPRFSQWMQACTKDGTRAFPYGDSFDGGTCNTDTLKAEPVRSYGGCVGGYDGLYDMSGSAEEWEDSCSLGDAGATDSCYRRGGSFNDGTQVANYACASALPRPRSATDGDCGFRCCSRP